MTSRCHCGSETRAQRCCLQGFVPVHGQEELPDLLSGSAATSLPIVDRPAVGPVYGATLKLRTQVGTWGLLEGIVHFVCSPAAPALGGNTRVTKIRGCSEARAHQEV